VYWRTVGETSVKLIASLACAHQPQQSTQIDGGSERLSEGQLTSMKISSCRPRHNQLA